MRAEDLRLEELVQFSEGLVDLHGKKRNVRLPFVLPKECISRTREGLHERCPPQRQREASDDLS